ncbi:ankyrin repeat domain-containing protein [Candidatus Babeliales bacterium]|nr:ankyrin repeat domain-containing protein [Candidatus Babeliales bacterium]
MVKNYCYLLIFALSLLTHNSLIHAAASNASIINEEVLKELKLKSKQKESIKTLVTNLSCFSSEACLKMLEHFDTKLLAKIINLPLTPYRETLLHIVCKRDAFSANFNPEYEAAIVIFLLDNGSQINAKNFYGSHPLHCACFSGNVTTVSVLINHQAPQKEPDNNGKSPLNIASERKAHHTQDTECDKIRSAQFAKIISCFTPAKPARPLTPR